METLSVQMLGDFVLRRGDRVLEPYKGKARKQWLLLAYLVYHRDRPSSQEELFRVLWGDEESRDDPANALRVMLHRLRGVLAELEGEGSLILREREGYRWNPDCPVVLDAQQFEEAYRQAEQLPEGEAQMNGLRKALALYGGSFLDKLSSEPWARNLALRYSNLYTAGAARLLPLLEESGSCEEAAQLCGDALRVEPLNEYFCCHLMENLLKMGQRERAVEAYEGMRREFFNTLGTMPAARLRELYYQATRKIYDHALSAQELSSQLMEPESRTGALLCDFDFFKAIYQAAARMLARTGSPSHIALLTVDEGGSALSQKQLDRRMDNLLEVILGNLRRGDVVTRCSIHQYVILLQNCDGENSEKVCQRLLKAYGKKYPRALLEVSYSVRPLSAEC